MDSNVTANNNTLLQVFGIINATVNNTVDISDNSVVPLKDLYEDYRSKEKYRYMVYRVISYILASLIILSNLSVVISSGLILKKGQKPKSTYILLGNVSLADTIVGLSIFYGLSVEYTLNTDPMCAFQMGMLVSPAMVSILSVGLIAVDRYIYILHGLYYQRWFNTTRVRIGIVLIWFISLTLGFLPVTGWVNEELASTRCIYVGLFPIALILFNSIISVIPIIVVAVLYTIILVKALKTVKTINNTIKIREIPSKNENSQVRMNRRTFNTGTHMQSKDNFKNNDHRIKRSASFNFGTKYKPEFIIYKTKSIENLSEIKTNNFNLSNIGKDRDRPSKIHFESDFSVCSIESMASAQSSNNKDKNNQPHRYNKSFENNVKTRKVREPNKWRAIKVVMLTTASVIFTWIPFFVTVIFFVFCEEKLTNPKCIQLRALLGGPLAILAFFNCSLNPLIYAWWHKGFQKSVKTYYKQYLLKHICRVVR